MTMGAVESPKSTMVTLPSNPALTRYVGSPSASSEPSKARERGGVRRKESEGMEAVCRGKYWIGRAVRHSGKGQQRAMMAGREKERGQTRRRARAQGCPNVPDCDVAVVAARRERLVRSPGDGIDRGIGEGEDEHRRSFDCERRAESRESACPSSFRRGNRPLTHGTSSPPPQPPSFASA